MWSYGCVLAELLLGSPIFPGGSGVDHLVEIIKVLGSPSKEELRRMNPNYQDFKFPNIQAHALSSVFPEGTNVHAVSLCEDLLRYGPERRSGAVEVLFCPFHLPVLSDKAYRMPEGSAALAGQPLPAEFLAFTETDKQAAAALGEEYVDALTAAAAAGF
jgi:serine/threonine protein kinase